MLSHQLSEQEYRSIIKRLQAQSLGYIRNEEDSDRKILKNLLDTLLSEIFKDKKNFLFELIQNADDQEATEISISLDREQLIFSHNSIHAFTRNDLNRISSAGETGKKQIANKIGHKGIGFKNVFKVTKYPKIYCGNLRFTFRHRDHHYRVIYPEWLDEPKRDDARTYFILNLDLEDVSYELIREATDLINPETLLFLNHIQRITIEDNVEDSKRECYREILRNVNKDCTLVRIGGTNDQAKRPYHVFSKRIPLSDQMQRFWERDSLPGICIAVPLDENERIIAGADIENMPDFYVYLPTKLHLGFRFILHGDFDTEVDRRDITDPASSEFNEYMLKSVKHVFDTVVDTYKEDCANQVRFLSLIPQESDNPNHPVFTIIQQTIFEHIRQRELFLAEAPDNTFKRAKDICLNMTGIRKVISRNEALRYYNETEDHRYLLSSDVTEHRALKLFAQLGGKEMDLDIILDMIEYVAKANRDCLDWFLLLYTFLASYLANISVLSGYSARREISKRKLILTGTQELVDASRTVFYFDREIKYIEMGQLSPVFLHEGLDVRQTAEQDQEIVKFLENVLHVAKFDVNAYVSEYLLPWMTVENIKKEEQHHHAILKYLFEFSSELRFGLTILLFDRNEELLPQHKLYLGNDYRNEYRIETLFTRCGVTAKYISKKYRDSLGSDVKAVRDFLVRIGVRNIMAVREDPNSIPEEKLNHSVWESELPETAKYVISEAEYGLWPKEVIRRQRTHGHIYKVNNFQSEEMRSICRSLPTLDEDLRFKMTNLLLTMLDRNWESYYSDFTHCTIYHNPNDTPRTKWYRYYYREYENSKLSDFGKLTKLKLQIPNIVKQYYAPSNLCVENPLNKERVIGIKLYSVGLIKFLNIQGSSSLSDLIDHLRNLRKGNEHIEDPKAIYLDICEKLKLQKNSSLILEHIMELKKLIYLPLEKRWCTVADDVYFEDSSGIDYPYFSSISHQLGLSGITRDKLRDFFVKQLAMKQNPTVEKYVEIISGFPSYKRFNGAELESVLKLIRYLVEKDVNLLKGNLTLLNNNGYLREPEKLYFLDIPLKNYKLDDITVHTRLNRTIQRHRKALRIESIGDTLSVKSEEGYNETDDSQAYLEQLQQLMYIIKEMMNSGRRSYDEKYDALSIKLIDQVILTAPNGIELVAYYYVDRKTSVVYLNPDKAGNEELIAFAFLFVDFLRRDISAELQTSIKWVISCVKGELPWEQIISLLRANGFAVNFENYVPIPVMNLEDTEPPEDGQEPSEGSGRQALGEKGQIGVELPGATKFDPDGLERGKVVIKKAKRKGAYGGPPGKPKPPRPPQGPFKIIRTSHSTERISVSLILEREKSEGYNARVLNTAEQKKHGCDIISRKGDQIRYIEIKAYSSKTKREFQVQRSQYEAMQRHGANYWIYLVRPEPYSLIPIQDPLNKERNGKLTLRRSTNYFCELHGEFEEEYYTS